MAVNISYQISKNMLFEISKKKNLNHDEVKYR